MTERVYTVISKRGTTIDSIQDDLTRYTLLDNIPNRTVDIAHPRAGSQRQTYFSLTDAEAAMIRNDPRVEAVEIPAEYRDDITLELNAKQTGDFRKTSLDAGNFVNWGLVRHMSETYNFTNDGQGNNLANTNEFAYSFDGEGVDVVIQDSGLQADHPEWEDKDGNSRYRSINWYTASGISGTQSANHDRDTDGHGTHCGGIAAGKTFGWAKGAHVYAQKVAGLEGSGDSGTGISVSDVFDTIRGWHNAKTNGRPTVVNMSWGYGYNLAPSSITTGVYRGTSWDFATDYGSVSQTLQNAVGIIIPIFGAGNTTRMPVRIASVDTDVEEMIDAGIHVCIAAGNNRFKVDVPGGPDYDNTVLRSGVQTPYHRGSSPYSEDAMMVGNILDATFGNRDTISTTSTCGPGVNMWAGGSNIMSCTSNTNKFSDAPYQKDSNFRQCNISGTSMASPQVAGVIACILQKDSSITPAQMQALLIDDSVKDIIYDTASIVDYGEPRSMKGSPNRILFNRYNNVPFQVSSNLRPRNGLVIRSG